MTPSNLGQKVTLFRQKIGINQRELSRASGVSQASISRLEAGHVQQLRAGSLRRVAEVLRVPLVALLSDTEEVPTTGVPPVDNGFEWFRRLSADDQHWVRNFGLFLELMAQCSPASQWPVPRGSWGGRPSADRPPACRQQPEPRSLFTQASCQPGSHPLDQRRVVGPVVGEVLSDQVANIAVQPKEIHR